MAQLSGYPLSTPVAGDYVPFTHLGAVKNTLIDNILASQATFTISGKIKQIIFNVIEYGAVGDGTTDNITAFNLAASAALSAGGGIIFIPPGIYMLSQSWNMPSQYITIQGSGYDVTILRAISTSGHWGAGTQLIGTGGNDYCKVFDLTVDGNHRLLATSVQGISVRNFWIVERIKFYDMGGFKLWVNGMSHVRVRNCIWYSTASGSDNIGGGGNTDFLVEGCYFDPTINGNAIDMVNGDITIRSCYFNGNGVSGGVYLEGCSNSTVENSTFIATAPAMSSNSGYNPATLNMPMNNKFINNTIDMTTGGGRFLGISYGNYAGATTVNTGGNNLVSGNIIINPPKGGVSIFGGTNAGNPLKTLPDTIIGNKIVNPNTDGTNTWNTGIGVFYNAGIILGDGLSDIVSNNTIIDTTDTPNMQYGICLTGTSTGTTVVDSPVVTGNTITNATVEGIGIRSTTALTGNPTIQNNFGTNIGYIEKTANYTIGNYISTVNCTSGTFTTTLPTAVGISGKIYMIKNSGAGTITLATTGGQTIDGVPTLSLAAGVSAQVISNNANWFKIG